MILKYFEKLDEMSKIENNPFEKNLHEIYEEELISPILIFEYYIVQILIQFLVYLLILI